MNSASLYSLAGRYDNPIPPQFLAPIDFLKIPALVRTYQCHHKLACCPGKGKEKKEGEASVSRHDDAYQRAIHR
jgi:hypothetical protein